MLPDYWCFKATRIVRITTCSLFWLAHSACCCGRPTRTGTFQWEHRPSTQVQASAHKFSGQWYSLQRNFYSWIDRKLEEDQKFVICNLWLQHYPTCGCIYLQYLSMSLWALLHSHLILGGSAGTVRKVGSDGKDNTVVWIAFFFFC